MSQGMIADLVVHVPDKEGGIPNPHFHVMTTMRPLNADGSFGAKQRREYVLDCHIDHRSYVRQRLDLIPTVHEGHNVRKMEAKGLATEKGQLNRWIRATNRWRFPMSDWKGPSARTALGCSSSTRCRRSWGLTWT